LSWASETGTSPAGSDTQIQFNNAGSFGADSNLIFDSGQDFIGVGVSAVDTHNSAYSGIEISATGEVAGSGSDSYISENMYIDTGGDWTYKATDSASWLYMANGASWFYVAPSGTADTNISPLEIAEFKATGATEGKVTFNLDSYDVDFQVNHDTGQAIFVEGSSGLITLSSINDALSGQAFGETIWQLYNTLPADPNGTLELYDSSQNAVVILNNVSGHSEFSTDIFIKDKGINGLQFIQNTATNGTEVGMQFKLGDSASATAGHIYSSIVGGIEDNTNTSEDGYIGFHTSLAGTNSEKMRIASDSIIFNEDGADINIRMESDTITNAFFLDGGTGNIGLSNSSLESWGSDWTAIQIGGNGAITTQTTGGANNSMQILLNAYYDGTNYKYMDTDEASRINVGGSISLQVASSGTADANITWENALAVRSDGGVVINEAGASDIDFRVESGSNLWALHVDASSSRVGIEAQTLTTVPCQYRHCQ
jgi:hypothetical protein